MLMYNLLEYSDNYAESSGSLWQLKRDEKNMNNDGNLDDVTKNGSKSFKYKSNNLGASTAEDANRKFQDVKIVVPLKYLFNFFRNAIN